MTKTEIRDELKRLHPDKRGGDSSCVPRLIKLLKVLRGPMCPVCGGALHSPAKTKAQNETRKTCSQMCSMISRRRLALGMGLVVVFAATLCFGVTFQMPTVKRKPVKLVSPRVRGEMANAAMAITLPPPYVPQDLTWDYDLPLPRDVTFVVLMAKTPNGPWTTFTETNQPPVRVNPVGFYKIETKNNL
jgi:hypothetical protein